MKRHHNKINPESKIIWIVLALLVSICLVPFLLVLGTSLSNENAVIKNGYTIIPADFDLWAYQFLLDKQGAVIARGFMWSILQTVCGTLYCMFVNVCFAYAVTQPKSEFRPARFLSLAIWVTSIIGGGTLPWYILCTQAYGLKNNLLALFLPTSVATFNIFILRGNFRQVPIELKEAALLDGASQPQIFTRVYLPLSRNGLATVAMFYVVGFWNDYHYSLYLITDSKKYTMQRVLNGTLNMMSNLLRENMSSEALQELALPMHTTKMALIMISVVPILLIYPFALKYIVKGMTLGGVKG